MRLHVEALEARWVPSYTLTNLGDLGGGPQGGLVADSSGNLFGASGGADGHGQLFEWVKASNTKSVLATFNGSNGLDPNGGLVVDSSGNLFGTTGDGGPNDAGTVFEWVKSTGTLSVLASFNGSNGSDPNGGLIADSSGNLFGTTQVGGANGDGAVFEWVKSTGALSVLGSFNGTNGNDPNGGIFADTSGNLFGTTQVGGANGNGAVFEWVKSTGALSVLGSFNGTNGNDPNGGIFADTSGNLFGTTQTGGANDRGTVFQWVKASGSLSVLASFNNSNPRPTGSVIADSTGNLFGTTYYGGTNDVGTVFEWIKSSGSIATLASLNGGNPAHPNGGLVQDSSGNLFGTTSGEEVIGGGTVFEWVKSSASVSVLASFNGGPGFAPSSNLVADTSGNLFGTSSNGGANNVGTVFEWVKATGTLSVLATFNGSNGAYPEGRLIADTSGNLFGTTFKGGANNDGTVFEWVKSSGTLSVLASFNGGNGANPGDGLFEDASGNLFGTTRNGADYSGTLFEWVKSSGSIATLASFGYESGPTAGLVADTSGNLFGTTDDSGSAGRVFEWVKASGTLSILASLNGDPSGDLVADSSGNLFGTTSSGGANGDGTMFEWVKGTGALTTLASFNGGNGANPSGGLIADTSGNLFGTTFKGGGNNEGTAFEWVKGTGALTTLASFNGGNGANPSGGLVADTSGNLFGTTEFGGGTNGEGTNGAGTVFELVAKSTTWTGLSPLNHNWSNPGNWSDGVPVTGETVIFSTHPGGSSTAVVDAPFSVALDIDKNWGGTIQVNQSLTTTGSSHWDSGTISVAGGVTWTNTGITLGGSTNLSLSGTGKLSNTGTLIVASGTTFTDSGEYTQTGTLVVQGGATADLSGTFDNYDGAGTLTGGAYDVQGTFQFTGAAITTNAATLVLDGTGSRIINQSGNNGLANFATNASGAGFTIQNGRNFSTSGDFENDGTLTVGPSSLLTVTGNDTDTATLKVLSGGTLSLLGGGTAGGTVSVAGTLVVTANQTFTDSGSYSQTGTLRVLDGATATLSGTFSNYDGKGTLTGGTYNITGAFQFANAAVVTDAATVILNGSTAGVTDLNGTDALGPNLTTITSAGQLSLVNGATFTSPGNFTVAGKLNVGSGGSAFTSGGSLTAASGATLAVQSTGSVTTTGDFNVQANVAVPNGAAVTVGGNLNVSGGTLLDVQDGGALGVSGNVSNSGVVNVGAVTVSVGGSFTEAKGASLFIASSGGITTTGDFNVQSNVAIAGGVTVSVGGNLNVAAGAALTVQTGGSLSTAGDFNDFGRVVIGAGVTVNVGGNYTQDAAAYLTIELGGTGAGQFGALAVTGTATLNGILQDALVNGYVPKSSDSIPVLTYATRSGDFTTGPAGFSRNYDDVGGSLTLVKQ